MSKDSKISALKTQFKPVMKKIIVSNSSAYGGKKDGQASIAAALSNAVAFKIKQHKKGQLKNGVSKNDWIDMGRELNNQLKHGKSDKVNAVCDTCSGYAIYVMNSIINFTGRIELFAEKTIHHHYVVVDRKAGSDPADYTTWGSNAFVVDLWQAKFSGREETSRGFFSGTAHHWKHGIYRNPAEHVYTRNKKGKYKYKAEHLWVK